jgi:glucan biosynthesis protein C
VTQALSSSSGESGRRADLDWIRVGAFGLLIVYHVALVYAPWDWHVHSQHYFGWLKGGAVITNPWRLALLFLVSGCAVRLMSVRRTAGEVARGRLERLIPPLVFGVLVIVPPQAYIEAISKFGFMGTYVDWMAWQFAGPGLARIPLNHLWFAFYILMYSAVAVLLLAKPQWVARLETLAARHLAGWRILALPIAYLIAVRILLYPLFGVTNRFSVDWYNHSVVLVVFVFGFIIVRQAAVWRDLETMRGWALAIAAVALPTLIAFEMHPGGAAFLGVPRAVIFATVQWSVIAAILGFGSLYLRGTDGPVLRWLSQAIFPCYLVHQTILVAAGFWLLPHGLAPGLEAALLIGITFAGSVAVYEIVRRIGWLRPVMGLKPLGRRKARAAAGAVA